MKRTFTRNSTALCLLIVLGSTSQPAGASTGPKDAPRRQPNRQKPVVHPVPQSPAFSEWPTDAEIFKARVFAEPLVPVGATTPEENAALARAIRAYLQRGGGERVEDLTTLLEGRTLSPWRASLRLNLGIVYRRTGYFSRALAAFEEAWAIAASATDPQGRAVAARAAGELAQLHARLGNQERLEQLYAEMEGRKVGGTAAELLEGAKQGLWLMQNQPHRSFRCGPLAVERILASVMPGHPGAVRIHSYDSTSAGTSLLEMRVLANEFDLGMQAAFRTGPDAEILVPALVHWKAGHFAAVVKEESGRYLIEDATFGEELWISKRAFEDESSGYMLVRGGRLPVGWRGVADAEAARVRGKGQTQGNDPQAQKKTDHKCDCENGGNSKGLASYSMHTMLVNLTITDTPVGYSPPRGPAVNFMLTYNQREAFQPQTFFYGNVGAKWNFVWQSYIEDDPVTPSQPVYYYVQGGGQETYTGYNAGTQSYARHRESRSLVKRVAASPVRYERHLIDGSVEEFGQPDSALAFPRKVFLTRLTDPQGNSLEFTYDGSLRLVAVTDAIGQVTTLSYELPGDPLKITKVTDPFGRFATLEYDGSGRLVAITDVIGMESSFEYEAGDFVKGLTTPYGTTTFAYFDEGRRRWLEATDPLGGRERLEYVNISYEAAHGVESAAFMPFGLPGAEYPTGGFYPGAYPNLNTRNTFFWSKLAMARAPGSYAAAKLTHWLHLAATNQTSGVIENEKQPLESRRTFYQYPDWPLQQTGTYGQPSAIGRVVEDGSSQIYRFVYNARGRKTKEIDPLLRETVYVYGNNNTPDANPTTGEGIDLLQVKRKNGGSYDVLQSYSYNAQHLPLTITDALGAVTTYTYNSAGQVLTVTTPPAQGHSQGATTTFTYDTDGYLTQVSGPVPGATTTFTYDDYGRRRTVTDAAGLTLTYDYDALDRVIKVTYPDTTYEETGYKWLDVEKRRDRLGRWTHTFHDRVRRVTAVKDAAGRTTQYQFGGTGCYSCSAGGERLSKLVDANGNATTWQYDLQGRVIEETRADGSSETYTYEATSSRLKQKTDRKNVTTTFEYFLDGKLKRKSYSDSTPAVDYTYDPVDGLMLTAANGTDTLTWTYDSLDRVATEASSKNASVVGYSYDSAGNRTALTLNTATHVTYAYDQRSRPTGITRGSNTISFNYDTASRRTTMTYPNGVVTSYGYDAESRLTSLGANLGATPITSFSYALDAVGNRTRKTTLDWIEDYTYDETYRLLSADRSSGTPARWRFAYDPVGNRVGDQTDDAPMSATFNQVNELLTRQPGGVLAFRGSTNEPATVTVTGAPARTASDNSFRGQAPAGSGTTDVTVVATDPAGNARTNTYRVTAAGAGTTYTYDSNGNLTSKTEGSDVWVYTWNAENQLTKVEKNAVEQARYSYDPKGRRVEKVAAGVTTSYAYAGGDILRETTGSSVLKYVHGPVTDEPLVSEDGAGVMAYMHADGSGSVVKVSNSAGTVTATRRYDAFGNIELGAANGFGFTGREWSEEVGLYYYRARYYDARTGRFLSEDPLGLQGGMNLYVYVDNNPVRFLDPLGLSPKMTDFMMNPIRCIQGMRMAATYARMLLAGEFDRDNGDKRAHCLAFCQVSKECGPFWGGFMITTGVGMAKEAVDTVCFYVLRPEVSHHFGKKLPCNGPWSTKDLEANNWGASCPEDCESRCSDAPQRFK